MLPKIEFKYSRIYDQKYQENYTKENKKKWGEYPTSEEIKNYLKKIEKLWKKYDKKVLKELEKITGLKWKEEKIICYVIGRGKPFSDPLTISIVNKNPERFIDTLVHELIHQIQTQNSKKFLKAVKPLWEKYNKEKKICKSHILLHAIHKEIYLKLFDVERLSKDIEKSKHLPDGYYHAWKIVEKEGHEKIIKEFRKGLN